MPGRLVSLGISQWLLGHLATCEMCSGSEAPEMGGETARGDRAQGTGDPDRC